MRYFLRIVVFLTILISMSQTYYAYGTDMNCGTSQISAFQPPFIPTTGTVRTLVFFVMFRDDSFGTGGCEDDPVQGWPDTLTTLAVWANDFIDDTVGQPYTPGGLSDYLYQM